MEGPNVACCVDDPFLRIVFLAFFSTHVAMLLIVSQQASLNQAFVHGRGRFPTKCASIVT